MSAIDFEQRDPTALRAAVELRERFEDTSRRVHPELCGPCPDCKEFMEVTQREQDEYEVASRACFVCLGSPPSAKQLVRHVELYGADGAELYGVQPARRKRASGRSVKDEITVLVARGLQIGEIAEALDLSPARARQLVGQVGKTSRRRR